jgi:hypothetical protein
MMIIQAYHVKYNLCNEPSNQLLQPAEGTMHTVELVSSSGIHDELFQGSDSSVYVPQLCMHTH